ncbi:UNVERIFIED_CONTAM: hypothetical protein NCL1_23797 [Trichonephila clavipes]
MEKKPDRIPLASMEELNVEGSPQPQVRFQEPSNEKDSDSCPAYEMQRSTDTTNTPMHLQPTGFRPLPSKPPVYDRYILNLVESCVLDTYVTWCWNIDALEHVHYSKVSELFWGVLDYKLHVNDTDVSTEEYRAHFLSYLGVAAQVPNVICNALNIFVQFGGGTLTFRIIGSIIIEIIIFIVTVFLAMVDSSTCKCSQLASYVDHLFCNKIMSEIIIGVQNSDIKCVTKFFIVIVHFLLKTFCFLLYTAIEGPGIFFYVTMTSVVVINMANGIYQNSIYGLAAKLPMKYSMAIVLGAVIDKSIMANFPCLCCKTFSCNVDMPQLSNLNACQKNKL